MTDPMVKAVAASADAGGSLSQTAALQTELVAAQASLIAMMEEMAREGYRAWDGGHEARAGKILGALGNPFQRGYRLDLDKARNRVEQAVAAIRAAERAGA